MKIRSVGGELFHADRRTDTMKLIVVFRNFRTRPKKKWCLSVYVSFLCVQSI